MDSEGFREAATATIDESPSPLIPLLPTKH
jgi:hypothetical protein